MLFHCGFNCIIGRADVEAEAPILWPPDAKSWLIWKDPDAGKDWGQEEKGMTEDEMVGWHHWLDGYGFGWTLGVGDGQGGLACCGSWGCKESDTTEQLNWTELIMLNIFKTVLTFSEMSIHIFFTFSTSLHFEHFLKYIILIFLWDFMLANILSLSPFLFIFWTGYLTEPNHLILVSLNLQVFPFIDCFWCQVLKIYA